LGALLDCGLQFAGHVGEELAVGAAVAFHFFAFEDDLEGDVDFMVRLGRAQAGDTSLTKALHLLEGSSEDHVGLVFASLLRVVFSSSLTLGLFVSCILFSCLGEPSKM